MGTSDGQVLGLTKITDAGPANQRWNVAIVSEGYRSDEMTQFATDAEQFAEILLSTEDSVAEIAAAVGYGSEAAFNRAFKREFACPPAQFRRQRKSLAAMGQ